MGLAAVGEDGDVGPVVDLGVDLVGVVTLVDIDLEALALGGFARGVGHEPEGIVGALGGGVAVTRLEVAVLKVLAGPDVAGGPLLTAALLFAVGEAERAVVHDGVFTPATVENVSAGAVLGLPALVELGIGVVELVVPYEAPRGGVAWEPRRALGRRSKGGGREGGEQGARVVGAVNGGRRRGRCV